MKPVKPAFLKKKMCMRIVTANLPTCTENVLMCVRACVCACTLRRLFMRLLQVPAHQAGAMGTAQASAPAPPPPHPRMAQSTSGLMPLFTTAICFLHMGMHMRICMYMPGWAGWLVPCAVGHAKSRREADATRKSNSTAAMCVWMSGRGSWPVRCAVNRKGNQLVPMRLELGPSALINAWHQVSEDPPMLQWLKHKLRYHC